MKASTPAASGVLCSGIPERKHKSHDEHNTVACFYLGPDNNHPCDTAHVFVKRGHSVAVTRDFVRRHLPHGKKSCSSGLFSPVSRANREENGCDDIDYNGYRFSDDLSLEVNPEGTDSVSSDTSDDA